MRPQEPCDLLVCETRRPLKSRLPHGSGLSLGNREQDLSSAVFHVAGHRNGGRPPDEPLPRQKCPHGLLRVGKVLPLDGGTALQSRRRGDLRRGEPLRPRHFDLGDQGKRSEEEEEFHLSVRLASERGNLPEDRFLVQTPNRRAYPLPGEPIPRARLDEPREFLVGDQKRRGHMERDRGDDGTGGSRRGGLGRRRGAARKEEERRRQEKRETLGETLTPFHAGNPSTGDICNGT
ncbi:MAG: hypothetical protein HW377_2019 [Actinobacteria bacterium]|nr:hypothetical protein [Actinomycetota bacterium]